MKNWTVFVKLSLVVLLAAGCTQVFAQPYPITGIVILLPSTPDQNTGNWGNMRPQFTITATANSTSRKMDPAVSQSKMLMIITKGGDKVCGAYSINSAPAANFNNWNKVWTGIYAARFLGQGCILPPGDYQLSVQFFGYQNGEIVALSEEKIKAFSISGNGKPTNQQPGEINPGINIQKRPTNPKRPIYPQQTVLNPLTQPDTKPNNIKSPPDKQPGADNAAVTTDTKPTNTNKPVDQQASGGNPAVEPEPKPANPRKPGLLDRLRKINIGGISQGTISINLGSLASCDCGNWSPITINRTLKIDCGGKNVIPWKCGEAFDFLSTYNCTSKDKSCHAVTAWQIKKDGALVVDGQGDHNITGEFIPQANGRYILTLTADCNGKKCEPCVYTIDIEDCKTCNCGTWGPLLVSRDVKYDCGYKNIIPWKCSRPLSFSSTYRCGAGDQNCQAETSWEIAKDGVAIKTGNGNIDAADSFTPNANGTYTITLYASCNGIKCPPCVYTIGVNDCKMCGCGTWGPLAVNNAVKFDNGSKNAIPWKCNQPFNFTSVYRCSQNGQGCYATTTWQIAKDGVSIKTGSGDSEAADSFTPTGNGTYIIALNAACNGIKCPPAVYTIVVEDCKTCDCGTWSPLAVNNAVKFENGYKNAIPWKCNQPFNFTSVYRCSQNSQGCEATTTWQIAKDGASIKTGSSNSEVADSFTPTANGTYIIALNAACNGIKCPPAVYTVVVEDCTTCNCGTWGPLAVNNKVKFESGNKNNIPWKCSQPFSFTSTYRCGPNSQGCQATTTWQIAKDGVSIKTGSGNGEAADSFTPTGNGTYIIALNAACNGIKCPPAVYTVIVEDCTTCDCGNWVSPLVNIRANGSIVSALKCGESATLSKGSYSIAIPGYNCSLNDASCAVSYSWSVQGGPVVVNGTRQTFNYNFGQAGTYTIDITPICGRKKCQPCKLQVIIQDNLPPVNVEKPEKKRPVARKQHYYYVISPEYAGELVSVKDTLFLQIENNYSSGSNQLTYTIRNLSNDKTSRLTKLAVTNNQGMIRIALPLQNSVVLKGETGQLIMGDYKKYYYISFKRN